MTFALAPHARSVPAGDTVIRDGLVSRWPFDDGTGSSTARDDQGTNPGTLSGMDPQTAWVTGRHGNDVALRFNGSPEQLVVSNAPELNPALISICTWFKSNEGPPSVLWPVFCGKPEDNNWRGGYGLHWRLGLIRFFYGNFSNYASIPEGNLFDQNWHLLIGIYDGAEKQVYLDNVAGTPYVGAEPQQNYPSDFSVAFMPGGQYIDQTQQDVRIYNRALSASERTAIFNSAG